jgi:hypothetical protein
VIGGVSIVTGGTAGGAATTLTGAVVRGAASGAISSTAATLVSDAVIDQKISSREDLIASAVGGAIGGGVSGGVGYGIQQAKLRLSNAKLVQEVANRAERWGIREGYGPAGGGPGQGTAKHNYAADLLDRVQRMELHRTGMDRGLETEGSWLAGRPAPYGTKGSARLDVWDPSSGTVYDYKFVGNPGQGLGATQVQKIMQNGPGGITSVVEVNPQP